MKVSQDCDGFVKVTVPARRESILFFIAPLFVAFSIGGIITLIPFFQKSEGSIIGILVISLFLCLFLYMGVTSVLALLWTLFGKDCIAVDRNGINVERILFFRFSSTYYYKNKMLNIYVNSRDYEVNKISMGRNDFLAAFRIGTIHFHYENNLEHIAGGMTDAEGKMFLDQIAGSYP